MSRHHTAGKLVALFMIAVSLTACGDADVVPAPVTAPPSIAQVDDSVAPTSVDMASDAKVGNSLPIAKTLVRIHAHVATSMALRRVAQNDMAIGHVADALNDDHAADLRTLSDLGLRVAMLEWMATPHDGSSSDDFTRAEVDAHFDELAYRAGANPLVLTQYALTQMLARYDAAVAADQPVDVSAYQLAFGFATVANHRASSIKGEAGDALRSALADLLALWPEGPLPPQFAATTEQVRDQVDRIRDVLRYAR